MSHACVGVGDRAVVAGIDTNVRLDDVDDDSVNRLAEQVAGECALAARRRRERDESVVRVLKRCRC